MCTFLLILPPAACVAGYLGCIRTNSLITWTWWGTSLQPLGYNAEQKCYRSIILPFVCVSRTAVRINIALFFLIVNTPSEDVFKTFKQFHLCPHWHHVNMKTLHFSIHLIRVNSDFFIKQINTGRKWPLKITSCNRKPRIAFNFLGADWLLAFVIGTVRFNAYWGILGIWTI